MTYTATELVVLGMRRAKLANMQACRAHNAAAWQHFLSRQDRYDEALRLLRILDGKSFVTTEAAQ